MLREIFDNPILDTDSYKFSHWKQYPPNTTDLMAYVESRGGSGSDPGTIVFGYGMILDEMTRLITKDNVEKAQQFVDRHIGPNIFPYEGWMHIVNAYGGRIPLEIAAVPEGEYVPSRNVLMTVRSTDRRVFWLTSWYETRLLRIWYTINIATISNSIKKLIYEYLVKTSDDPDGQINFKLHDFGARGVSSEESAALGGAAHLINFMGSDTVRGVQAINHYYNNDEMSGFSIPATEHSTITTWGKDGEVDGFRNMLTAFKGSPLIACVSDSYDIFNAVENIWGHELKDLVINSGSMLVVRPDSGKLPETVLKVVVGLENAFGHTVNSKGFKVLNNVRVIQGDGIEEGTIRLILFYLTQAGYSTDNIAFGMGGALLQQHNRDTYKFAYKHCLAKINGKYIDVFKDPVTDPGKRSRAGNLDLVKTSAGYKTIDRRTDSEYSSFPSELVPVFKNGEILKRYPLSEIRQRIDSRIKQQVLETSGVI